MQPQMIIGHTDVTPQTYAAFTHTGTVSLETPRLVLRPLVPADALAMYDNWGSDEEVTRFLDWPPYEDADGCREYIESLDYTDVALYFWGIEFKEIGEVIGTIAAQNLKAPVQSVELSYVIGRHWWGKGIVPEAVSIVEKHLFENVGVKVIRAFHDVANPGSGKVMIKNGMKKEGLLRRAGVNNLGVCDMEVYSILEEEWRALQESH